jgi:UDP-4-amino-4,6-dideoxy-N-acetyl-beta-L-altrosamine N-acetyltransferase
MNESDLEQVLKWRNHPDVRSYMYSTHEIRMDEHRAWYAHASKNPAKALLIYERDGQACGFVNITRTRCPAVADWGFYLAPDAPRGSGRGLGTHALNYAFAQLGLHKVCGQALGFNARSIAFHTRLGFTEEGRLRDQHFDGDQFHDVVCFGLLSNEWQEPAEE